MESAGAETYLQSCLFLEAKGPGLVCIQYPPSTQHKEISYQALGRSCLLLKSVISDNVAEIRIMPGWEFS